MTGGFFTFSWPVMLSYWGDSTIEPREREPSCVGEVGNDNEDDGDWGCGLEASRVFDSDIIGFLGGGGDIL